MIQQEAIYNKNMCAMKTLPLLLILSLTGLLTSSAQNFVLDNLPKTQVNGELFIYHYKTDTFFHSSQNINILSLPKENNEYIIEIAYSDSVLKKTSELAKMNNAIAAVNGGFFDVDSGGSVTYMEIEGKVINTTREEGQKWAKSRAMLNGAFIIDTAGHVNILPAKSDYFYEKSKDEYEVLVSGPLLLLNGKEVNLPYLSLVAKRHPRTCMCDTEESVLLITVDGRSETAEGMNLGELQYFLTLLGCKNAINLDGGGSTTMWCISDNNGKIVNNPSDKEGERPVANSIIIKRMKNNY